MNSPAPQTITVTEYAVQGTANDGPPGEWLHPAPDAATAQRRAERYRAVPTHYTYRAVQRTVHTGPWRAIPDA